MTSYEFLGSPLPQGAIIGLLGDEASGISRQLRRAIPDAASSEFLLIDYTLDAQDPLNRLRTSHRLSGLRRAGATILLATWDEHLLRELCDEIWWIEQDAIIAKGDPSEVLENWRAQLTAVWLGELTGLSAPIESSMQSGDSRASILAVELRNTHEQLVLAWSSGEEALIRVVVRFNSYVENPVVGMLIRTRIGLDVYGTNTELEKLQLGPCEAGDTLHIVFQFPCELCPGEYALTLASHDPDGTRHEWLEDAVAFSVSDVRYTAGIANLRAEVSWELVSGLMNTPL